MSYMNDLVKATNSLNVRGTAITPTKAEVEKDMAQLEADLKENKLSIHEYQQKKSMLVRKLTQAV